jgi:hypothetical protein
MTALLPFENDRRLEWWPPPSLAQNKEELPSARSFHNRIKALLHTAEGQDCCMYFLSRQAMQGSSRSKDRGELRVLLTEKYCHIQVVHGHWLLQLNWRWHSIYTEKMHCRIHVHQRTPIIAIRHWVRMGAPRRGICQVQVPINLNLVTLNLCRAWRAAFAILQAGGADSHIRVRER